MAESNRIKVTDQNGRPLWYNPKTGKLFTTKDGKVEIKSFTYDKKKGTVFVQPDQGKPTDECPPGYFWDAKKGRCVSESDDPQKCPPGYVWDKKKARCVEDAPKCPPGFKWDAKKGRCVTGESGGCPPGFYRDPATGNCLDYDSQPPACPDGFEWDNQKKICVLAEGGDPDHQCPQGSHWDEFYQKCVQDQAENCPDDMQWDEDKGYCVPITGEDTCPPGFEWDPTAKICVVKDEEEHECPDGHEWSADQNQCVPTSDTDRENKSAFAIISNALRRYGLMGLSDWAWQGILAGKSTDELLLELLDQPLYQKRFAGNFLRMEAGLPWIPEEQYLQYEAEAMRLARQRLGVYVSQDDVAQMIAGDVSLSELDQRLQTWNVFQKFGPDVRYRFDYLVGRHLSDQEVFQVLSFSGDNELERLLEDAQYTGMTAQIGLGFRPLWEAERLRRAGIDPMEAFGIYKNIARALPGVERMKSIEASLAGDASHPFDTMEMMFGAFTGLEPEQQEEMLRMLSRQIARFTTGGGPVMTGTSAPGFLTEGERRAEG